MSNPLSSKAEDLRQEIKALVAQAIPKSETPEENQPAAFTENVHGDKTYEGKSFEEKVSRLVNEMGLGKVWV